MLNIVLKRNLSEPTFAKGIAMHGVAVSGEVRSVSGDIYWRWEDEPTMEPELLGSVVAGHSLIVPFDPKGRPVRLYLVSKTEEDIAHVRDLRDAEQTVFTPPADLFTSDQNIVASEDLYVNALVNIWDSGGTPKVRLADATDDTRPCHGFVREESAAGGGFAPSSVVRVYFVGNKMTGIGGRTPGAVQYLRVGGGPGEMTETPPSASGNIVQQIGVAISDSEIIFNPEEYSVVP